MFYKLIKTSKNLLHLAARFSDVNTFKALLATGINIHHKDMFGTTPADIIQTRKRTDLAKLIKRRRFVLAKTKSIGIMLARMHTKKF